MPSRLTVLKPGQREGDGVIAGAEVDDLVLAVAVGDGRPRALDERRARRFDRHARQHGAGRVADDAGNAAANLCERGGRCQQHRTDDERDRPEPPYKTETHNASLTHVRLTSLRVLRVFGNS